MDRRNKSLYLSVARSIGDRQLKRPTAVLSAAPDVRVLPLEDDDLLAVVVCDGVTDVLDDRHRHSRRRELRQARRERAADRARGLRQVAAAWKSNIDAMVSHWSIVVTAVVVEFPWVDAAKVAAVRAKAKSAIAEAKKQQADEPLTSRRFGLLRFTRHQVALTPNTRLAHRVVQRQSAQAKVSRFAPPLWPQPCQARDLGIARNVTSRTQNARILARAFVSARLARRYAARAAPHKVPSLNTASAPPPLCVTHT